jgi:hypothetical protein
MIMISGKWVDISTGLKTWEFATGRKIFNIQWTINID